MAEESTFKWNNRKKATETAVELKHGGMTSEEAVKKVLEEYEGVFHVNGKEISEKRFNNFMTRVEKEKKYKTPKATPKEVDITQTRIKELLDKNTITELQALVLDSVFNLLASYQTGESDITVEDIAEESGIKVDRVKGALGHLIKKGFVKSVDGTIEGKTVTAIFIEDGKYELYNQDTLDYKEALKGEKQPDEELEESEANA